MIAEAAAGALCGIRRVSILCRFGKGWGTRSDRLWLRVAMRRSRDGLSTTLRDLLPQAIPVFRLKPGIGHQISELSYRFGSDSFNNSTAVLPDGGHGVRAVAAGLVGDGDEDELSRAACA